MYTTQEIVDYFTRKEELAKAYILKASPDKEQSKLGTDYINQVKDDASAENYEGVVRDLI